IPGVSAPQRSFIAGTSATQTINSTLTTLTRVAFNTTTAANRHNDGLTFNTATNSFTVTVAGVYQIEAGVDFVSTGGGQYEIYLQRNGLAFAKNKLNGANGEFVNCSRLVKLAVGEVITVAVAQNSGSARQIANTTDTYFSVFQVY
ncbi:MAG: hypothetical protein JNM68_11240, partial [Dinghuibacter sp.]|nr:hypothetical protein [Dinghuibacter sp.]